MIAPVLLLDITPQPPPVVGPAPRYQVFQQGKRVLRSSFTGLTPKFGAPGDFEFGAPLWVWHKGKRYDNPGLAGFFEGAPVTVMRDGHQKVADGFMDQPDIDLISGWCKFKCKDTTEDINRTNHGTGRNTGWTGGATDNIAGGWAAANAVVSSSTSPWGEAVSVGYGDDHKNPWHFAYIFFLIPGDKTLTLSAIVNLSKYAQKTKAITLSKRILSKPKAITVATASIPTDAAANKWSKEFSLPTIEGVPGEMVLVDIAVWSPMHGSGVNEASIKFKMSATDTTVVTVPTGGDSGMFCLLCFQQAFAAAGYGGNVVQLSPGMTFTSGVTVDPTDTSTFGSLIGKWASTVEWRWVADTATVELGGIGTLGRTWGQIRVTNIAGRTPAVTLQGASKGMAKRLTLTGSDSTGGSDRTFSYTYVLPVPEGQPAQRGWDQVVQAPDGANMEAYAQLEMALIGTPGRPVTVVLPPPPGGRTSGDWLKLGLQVGDRLPVTLDAGPFSIADMHTQRITAMSLDPTKGDTLSVTLEPIT